MRKVRIITTFVVVVALASPCVAQCSVQGVSESPSLKPAPNPCDADVGADALAAAGNAVTGYYVAAGAYGVVNYVGPRVADAAAMSSVGKLPVYGAVASNVPIIGSAAASVPIVPTTLGQTPFLGPVVSGVPVVGPMVAGPPNPVVLGVVTVDTFVLPKFTAGGYTESSMFTMTDFSSPPRLRHYVNYLAPMPYTHPPVYAPAIGTSAAAGVATEAPTGSVTIPY
jgi:hypothetical protein